jgi:hypothetical protein
MICLVVLIHLGGRFMLGQEVKIGDANAAVSVFGTLSRLSGSTRVPADQTELVARLSRVPGRARPLAVALNRYVEMHGFDAFRASLDKGRVGAAAGSTITHRADAEAAATVSAINFDEQDHTALTFAASGLY